MLKKLIYDVSTNSISHGSIPFWSWNDKLEEAELRKQINNMYDLGMKGFFMHARMGLETEYLSDEWYHAIDVCIDEARKLGMEAWSYDENGWPSGFGGGKVLEKPENYATSIKREVKSEFPTGEYFAVYAIVDGKAVRANAPIDGVSEYHVITLRYDVSYIDILNKRVIAEFIESTHEDYKKRIAKEDFGTVMPGFFTDEPQYFRYGMPWSTVIPDEFRTAYGYEVMDGLVKLFVDCEGYREFRHDYFLLLHRLFNDSFVKQIYAWCEENGCQLTGHAIEEASLTGQMMCCGGVMPFYRYEHIPGVDWLGRATSKSDILSKQLGSVCAQTGRERALSETFAMCGWDVSPSELKNIADYQYSGGVNVTCQHLYPYSIRGQRKRDYPLHYSEYLPWQKHLKDFNLYYNHLGYMLSLGKEHADTLVIHPIRHAYMYYNREFAGKSIETIERDFRNLSNALSGNQIAYHYGDETIMEDMASVEGATIRVGLCTYDKVVIPAVETLSSNTAKLLKKFVENGGKVYCQSDIPTRIDGREADLSWLKPNMNFEVLKGERDVIITKDGEAVSSVRAQTRLTENGRIIFVTNYTKNKFEKLDVKVKNCKNLVKLDILSLSPAVLHGESVDGDFHAVVSLDDSESFMLIESDEIPAAPVCEHKGFAETFKLGGEFRFAEKPTNSYTFDNLSYSFDGVNYVGEVPLMQLKDELLRARYEGDLYIKLSFKVDELPESVSYVCEPMEYKSVTVNGKPIELGESKYLDSRFLAADITNLVALGDNEICYSIHYFQSQHVYDVLFSDVSESFRNCLSIDTEIECAYLFGDFAVKTDKSLFEKVKTDFCDAYSYSGGFALTSQKDTVDPSNVITEGYPFFGGTLDLVSEYEYKKGAPTELLLNGRFAVAEVEVNGKPAKKMLFANHCNLSGLLKEGKNVIRVKITNAQRNLLGPLHDPKTENISVGPRSFTGEKQWQNGEWSGYTKDKYGFVRFGFDAE